MLMQKKLIILLSFMLMAVSGSICLVGADDDHNGNHRESRHERHEHEDDDHKGGALKPVNNRSYREGCGDCHFAYQPELLPSASWTKILAGLDDHFGEPVTLADDSKKVISDYLKSNGAETSSAKVAVRIIQSLGNEAPMRITEILYIRKKHYGVPADAIKNKAIGTLSNCSACHTTAENGLYDDDNVTIPR